MGRTSLWGLSPTPDLKLSHFLYVGRYLFPRKLDIRLLLKLFSLSFSSYTLF